MTRVPLVAGNWKMQLRLGSARALAEAVAISAANTPGVDVAIFPAFPHLAVVREALAGSRVGLGGQCCHDRPEGAHTGETSAEMLADAGCTYVLCGHSERRAAGESDEAVGLRVQAALRAGLHPILCVGETLAERESGLSDDVLRRQTAAALASLSVLPPSSLQPPASSLSLAYEPVWAIGTGRTATPETAVLAHRTVRSVLITKFGAPGSAPRILYGGSVKPSNAAELMGSEGVDGVLVGGASLEASSFQAILSGAIRS